MFQILVSMKLNGECECMGGVVGLWGGWRRVKMYIWCESSEQMLVGL